MAKRSRDRRSRDVATVANSSFPDQFELLTDPQLSRSGRLMAIEDRRVYSPGRVPKALTSRQLARITIGFPRKSIHSSSDQVVRFKLPRQVAVCARRSIRKQVIHAKGIAGRKVRKPRRNAFSNVSCRRK